MVTERVYNHFTDSYEELPTYLDATAFVDKLPPVRDFQAWLRAAS